MADEKVFLVTSGSYSDYGIRGAFSTLAKAQSAIDEAKRLNALYVEADYEDSTGGVGIYWVEDAGIEDWMKDAMRKKKSKPRPTR